MSTECRSARLIGLVIWLVLVSAPLFAADAPAPVAVHVRLINRAKVPRAPIEQAAQQVTRIYAEAGIHIVWELDAPSPTGESRVRDVVLLSPAMADRLVIVEGVAPRVLGLAGRAGSRAFIFTERITASAAHLGVDDADALGVVIAHELGHLLLPSSGHSSAGLMQSGYEFRNRSARRFTPAQAEAIRQGLVREQSW